MPMYNFDPAEEQDDLLEQELLDHGRDGTLTGPNAKVGRRLSSRKCTERVFFSISSVIKLFISLTTFLSGMKGLQYMV